MQKPLPKYLREYRVKLEPVPEGERNTNLEYPDDLGSRTKLGGKPDYIHGDDDLPGCPFCKTSMHFIAQIDSVEHKWKTNPNAKDHDDQQFMFGDVGVIYVFYCF